MTICLIRTTRIIKDFTNPISFFWFRKLYMCVCVWIFLGDDNLKYLYFWLEMMLKCVRFKEEHLQIAFHFLTNILSSLITISCLCTNYRWFVILWHFQCKFQLFSLLYSKKLIWKVSSRKSPSLITHPPPLIMRGVSKYFLLFFTT